jgi:Glycosyl hydrolases family 28
MDRRSLFTAGGTSVGRALFSRRETLPVLAASLGAGLIGGSELLAELRPASATAAQGSDRGARVCNVRDYGAKGDGITLDTAALQAAVDACTREGGGTVLVPAGIFLIGSLELKNNVTLHIVAGGMLLGSGQGKDYHAVDSIPLQGDSTLDDGNWALIYGVNAKNVTIEGPGAIDGQGARFHSPVRGTPPPSGLGGDRRPYHLLFYRCENLRVRSIDLVNSAYHSVRVIQCRRVHMDDIYIHNRVNGNNDGFHFISAEYVTVSNCTVLSLDDACALFGSCRNVTVTNSFFSTRWSVFRFGGGQVENIAVSNCVLHQVYGCPIKIQGTPGSRFANMSFSDLVLDDVTGPIHVSIGPRMAPKPHAGPTPVDALPEESNEPAAVVRNISFSNIHGTVTTNPQQMAETTLTNHPNPGEQFSCITLNCVGGAILEKISFDNIHLTFGGGGTADIAARRELPEIAGEYFMLGPLPAYGFYARNSRAITLRNVRFEVASPELRPALILDHVEDVAISDLSVEGNENAESAVRFIDAGQVLVTAPRLLQGAKVFLVVEGDGNSAIILDGGDLSKAAEPLSFKNGAGTSAVRLRD